MVIRLWSMFKDYQGEEAEGINKPFKKRESREGTYRDMTVLFAAPGRKDGEKISGKGHISDLRHVGQEIYLKVSKQS